MGISLKKWILERISKGGATVSVEEMFGYAEELRIRELAFNACVNMIANAVGLCEFKTYRNNKEIESDEYYLWNVEPNKNQNSTAFLHNLIYKLYHDNEALIVELQTYDQRELLAVADTYDKPLRYPVKANEYTGVTIGEVTYGKTFSEKEVLHFTLNHVNIKPVIDGMYQTYVQMIQSAMKNYNWKSGKHMKVHIDQIAKADPEFMNTFKQIMEDQVRPYLESNSAVLPEFDGYKYEESSDTGTEKSRTTRDIRALIDDIFTFTANAFGIPPVLLLGTVEGTKDAVNRWLTSCIDPLCAQIEEEITRKRYGLSEWKKGNYLHIDTTTVQHFDMFTNAANVEKLVGSAAYSVNDVRIATGQSKIDEPWADQHFMTKNIATMDEIVKLMTEGGEGNE